MHGCGARLSRTWPMQHPEHDAQVALFDWMKIHEANWPMLRFCAAIPNGDKITAALLKQEGVRRGVPDLVLPCKDVTGRYPGLWIELKYGRNKLSPEQQEWLTWLAAQGFQTVRITECPKGC